MEVAGEGVEVVWGLEIGDCRVWKWRGLDLEGGFRDVDWGIVLWGWVVGCLYIYVDNGECVVWGKIKIAKFGSKMEDFYWEVRSFIAIIFLWKKSKFDFKKRIIVFIMAIHINFVVGGNFISWVYFLHM